MVANHGFSAEKRIAVGAIIVAGVTGYMAYLGGRTDWQYYLTVDECLARSTSLLDSRIRITGTVTPGSLRMPKDRVSATFSLGGEKGTMAVACKGPLPDNFAESMQVVVEGRLGQPGLLRGEKVMTRCASKYGPQGSGGALRARPVVPEGGR